MNEKSNNSGGYSYPPEPFWVVPSSDPMPSSEQKPPPGKDDETQTISLLHQHEEELVLLLKIASHANLGITFEEILEFTYDELNDFIPRSRIGCALVEDDGKSVVARWCRSERPVFLGYGYSADLSTSTLQKIITSGMPRIINDLQEYLRQNPNSEQTELVVQEGMRSSLTCPLVVQGRAVGFLFFSSVIPNAYSNSHVAFLMHLASLLSPMVEKANLYTELEHKNQAIGKRNDEMMSDLRMAQKVQLAMMPAEPPNIDGLEIAFDYRPAGQVGGDILCIHPLSDNRVLFFLGDAMGHGVQAALLMSMVNTAVLSAIKKNVNPEKVFHRVNRLACRICNEQFVTAACCIVDISNEQCSLALAGHDNPLILTADGEVKKTSVKHGPLLGLQAFGIHEKSDYQQENIAFSKGDNMVFFTDGLTEAFNENDEFYGKSRIQAVMEKAGNVSPSELIEKITADLMSFTGRKIPKDDISILVVKRIK